MPHESFTDPITSNGTRFLSNMPVSELTECVTQGIEASDVSSTPSVVKTMDGATMGVWPPVSSRQDMGRTIKGGPAHKIKACTARLQVVLDIVIVPNRILYL